MESKRRAQAAVDAAHHVIVEASLTNRLSDKEEAEPMMELVKANTGELPRQLLGAQGTGLRPDEINHLYPFQGVSQLRFPQYLLVR